MKWKRGDRRSVKWHRNNHSNGFIRLTLVPAWGRMNKTAHAEHTFFYSCFDANRVKCDKKDYCGTGKYISSISFDVPAVADGDYVLGWSWFGSFSETNGKVDYHFADYWSCTKVRVRGGIKPKSERQPPGFDSGTEDGYCRALGNRIGVCNVEPCPDAYKGKSPRPMCPEGMRINENRCVGPTISPSPTPSCTPTPSVAPSYKEWKETKEKNEKNGKTQKSRSQNSKTSLPTHTPRPSHIYMRNELPELVLHVSPKPVSAVDLVLSLAES